MSIGDSRYAACSIGVHRYVVTRHRNPTVLGFAIRNDDETWSIEVDGSVVEVVFDSFRYAVDAILRLSERPN